MKTEPCPATCSDALRQAARCARLGMEAQASEHLRRGIDILLPLLPTLAPEILRMTSPLLAELLDAQERRDFCWFADLIEYRLTHLLQQSTKPE